jgi:alkaline phosphatase
MQGQIDLTAKEQESKREPAMKGRWQLTRRAFLGQGSLLLLGATGASTSAWADEAASAAPVLRIGLVTDLHYADRPPAGTRYYRETLAKFAEAAQRFSERKSDLVIGLGDLIDAADTLEGEKDHLRRIVKEFRAVAGQHHFALGNHCVWTLTKQEYLGLVGQEKSNYSFDIGDYHAIVLDACFRSDGEPYGRKNFVWTDANIPPAEIEWLQADLQKTSRKCILFVHQPLDMEPPHGVKNGPQIRKILEASGKVIAVLQGHYHHGGYQEIGGIHYCTLAAMIEGSGPQNNAYSIMDLLPRDMIRITGFRKQRGYEWK